jgi:hypothetical protein
MRVTPVSILGPKTPFIEKLGRGPLSTGLFLENNGNL